MYAAKCIYEAFPLYRKMILMSKLSDETIYSENVPVRQERTTNDMVISKCTISGTHPTNSSINLF